MEQETEAASSVETIEQTGVTRRTWSSAVVGGLAGGLLFGLLMQFTGVIPVVGALYGAEGFVTGWIAHLFNSVVFALVFAAVVARTQYRDASAGVLTLLGTGYGVALWLVAAAVVMPLWLGALGVAAPPVPNLDPVSLVGHVVYGAALGAVFAVTRRR